MRSGTAFSETRSYVFSFTADRASLVAIRESCRKALEANRLQGVELRRLVIAIDETAANVVEHGFPGGRPGRISVELTISDDLVRCVVRDRGLPFNPLSRLPAPPPVDRARDGYGLRLIGGIMDDLSYERRNGIENVFEMTKRRGLARHPPAPAGV